METGGDFGRESKRAVQELKAVAGAEGIHLKPSVSRKVDVFKDSFVKTEKKVKSGSNPTNTRNRLVDGSSMKTGDVLDLAAEFLGERYTEPVLGSGRFVSEDGTRVFRMGENDILGKHGGGPHVNFEILSPNPAKPKKMQVITNIHIFLED